MIKEELKILEILIKLSKKKVYFVRDNEVENLNQKSLKKFKKIITYKENKITNSLYQSASDLNINPYYYQVARLWFSSRFQRDIWKNDSFQIIYEEFLNENGEIIETEI